MPWLGGCCPPLQGTHSPGCHICNCLTVVPMWQLAGHRTRPTSPRDTLSIRHTIGTKKTQCLTVPRVSRLLAASFQDPTQGQANAPQSWAPPPTAGHTCSRTLDMAFRAVSRQYLVFASVVVSSGGQAKQEQGSCHLPAFDPRDFS